MAGNGHPVRIDHRLIQDAPCDFSLVKDGVNFIGVWTFPHDRYYVRMKREDLLNLASYIRRQIGELLTL